MAAKQSWLTSLKSLWSWSWNPAALAPPSQPPMHRDIARVIAREQERSIRIYRDGNGLYHVKVYQGRNPLVPRHIYEHLTVPEHDTLEQAEGAVKAIQETFSRYQQGCNTTLVKSYPVN